MSMKLRLAGLGGAAQQTYVDDVFSTYLYTGNSSTQTINNGIDLAGKGGLVWIKNRDSGSANHYLHDTARPGSAANSLDLRTNVTNAASTGGFVDYVSYGNSGFTANLVSGGGGLVTNGNNFAAWTFRKAAKFFDVVTYTGNGVAGRSIAHSLASVPGMIIVKRLDAIGAWNVYHQDLTYAKGTGAYLTTKAGENFLELNNTTLVNNNIGWWNNTDATSSVFTVGNVASVNAAGGTYVAYIFASDAGGFGKSGTENIIKCGYYVGDGTNDYSKTLNTGFEPQFVIVKKTSQTSDVTGWGIADTMRGLNTGNTNWLLTNSANAEFGSGSEAIRIKSTGFSVGTSVWNDSGAGYIYLAIRRPNKPPTSGTQVFSLETTLANDGKPPLYRSNGFTPDFMINKSRTAGGYQFVSRLTGNGVLDSSSTNAASATDSALTWDFMNGFRNVVPSGQTGIIDIFFKRAPGFFDVVCYTGNGATNRAVAHNLTVAPNMIIAKARSEAANWFVYVSPTGPSQGGFLNKNADWAAGGWTGNWFANTTPTANNFYISYNGGFGSTLEINNSGTTYVAYLFATLAGISKVGSYTGNGTSQNIDCGFAAGARFFLVKATSTTGSWWVWDSARGIVAGNDPALQLNSTAAEITTADAVDPYSPGITVNQEATCSINASGVSYVYLAIS